MKPGDICFTRRLLGNSPIYMYFSIKTATDCVQLVTGEPVLFISPCQSRHGEWYVIARGRLGLVSVLLFYTAEEQERLSQRDHAILAR